MKRMSALAVLAILAALANPSLIADQAATSGAAAVADHIALSWTGSTSTTMTVTWRTDETTAPGFVEYWTGPARAQSAKASSSEFVTDLEKTRLFTATLSGLTPGTRYEYRVGDSKQWSETHAFSTADPAATSFKFLVFGDSQSVAGGSSPYGVWRETVHNAYKANPDAKFMVNVGDLVDTGQSGAHWNGWFAAAKGVIDKIPAMPVVGNHDAASPSSLWTTQFHLPANGPGGLKNQVYSYDCGPSHLVALDSQAGLKSQARWLDEDLATTKAPWKMVFFHRPPYSVKPGRDNRDIRNTICPVLEAHHVDLVFSGHDHGVARTSPVNGVVYYIAGRSGTKYYKDATKQDCNTFFYNPIDQPNYLVVEVSDTKLTVKTVKQDGTLVDTFVIEKRARS